MGFILYLSYICQVVPLACVCQHWQRHTNLNPIYSDMTVLVDLPSNS